MKAMTSLHRTALLGAFLMLASPAAADEAATTHRAGDLVVYRFACHDARDTLSLARHGGANELAAVLMQQGKCFQSPTCIAARLEDWIDGPYSPPVGPPGSVWRVADQFGDTEYVWIRDVGGRHVASQEQAL